MGSRDRMLELPLPLRRWLGPVYSTPLASFGLLGGEALLCALIIRKVAYTEIDWTTYMQQIDLYLKGERDYSQLRGHTGPLVYPAGHVHAYAALHSLTDGGRKIRLAQTIFAGLYVATQASAVRLLVASRRVPLYVFPLLALSKRLHSIYVLRLFNEGVAMLPLYLSLLCAFHRRWRPASVLFSMALSVKMNILLYAPALALVILLDRGLYEALGAATAISLVQVRLPGDIRYGASFIKAQLLLALPFLLANSQAYLANAFDLSRVFLYRWTVNWRFLSEKSFLSRPFSLSLLAVHGTLLLILAYRLSRPHGTPTSLIRRALRYPSQRVARHRLSGNEIVTALCTANLIGILCARSLHYQFYAWYAGQLVYLLWQTSLPSVVRLVMLATIEWSWNVYPSTSTSSLALLGCHVVLVGSLLRKIGRDDAKVHEE